MNNLFKPAAYAALVLSSALLALAPAVAQDHSQHKPGHENHKNHTSMKAAKVSHSSSVYQFDAHWITHKGEHMTLADYVKQYNLNSDSWVFLHGEDQDIRTLATVLGVRYRKRPDGDFDHSNLITVLDKNGVIEHRVEGLGQPMDKAAKVVDTLIQQ
ncbi:SCO family protein [Idiomarina zobellii]|jgi:hypothetical protein|uniref:Uncharacterized protein n=1 Tax=Idiomarina zobellii TaxID=86103 RepID=A0A837NES6_9GAMM|nr:hypothetical protein [Idiomarina zobellii]KPD23790.1 hypothetical protein AFK76_06550 [Idiomarina zobellii]SDF73104.1 hypothetical protein SAMN04515658_10420 [Idiomarina zobellii]